MMEKYMRLAKSFTLTTLTCCIALTLAGCPQKAPVAVAPPPPPASAPADPLMVSPGVMAGNLQKPVSPIYPPEAKAKGLSGSVLLRAIITKTGTITNLRVIKSSNPIFNDAAIAAVQNWVYKPYMLNGKPTDVDTKITVNFVK